MNHSPAVRRSLLLLLVLAILHLPGCCLRKTTEKRNGNGKRPAAGSVSSSVQNSGSQSQGSGEALISGNESVRPLRDKDKRIKEHYRRLEYAFEMYNTDNFDGALREVERLQLEISNDPYLEMQSWYLSAMIYHKSDKPSRRKRAMRKMLESMEQVQKDPRFRTAFEDGMISQELMNLAREKGNDRYGKFE